MNCDDVAIVDPRYARTFDDKMWEVEEMFGREDAVVDPAMDSIQGQYLEEGRKGEFLTDWKPFASVHGWIPGGEQGPPIRQFDLVEDWKVRVAKKREVRRQRKALANLRRRKVRVTWEAKVQKRFWTRAIYEHNVRMIDKMLWRMGGLKPCKVEPIDMDRIRGDSIDFSLLLPVDEKKLQNNG